MSITEEYAVGDLASAGIIIARQYTLFGVIGLEKCLVFLIEREAHRLQD